MSISAKDILKEGPIAASAPCRVDSGGTWDIKAMALPLEHIKPVTVNIALNLRTTVTLSPFQYKKIKIFSEGFPRAEVFEKGNLPFHTPLGIFLAAISFFDVDGLEVHIRSDSPVKSAMGGSSTALVALIKALDKMGSRLGGKALDTRSLLHLAYHLEDGVSGGNCGIQDQGAAAYGGVNLWSWRYSNPGRFFQRVPLFPKREHCILSEHLIVAYSGKSHVSLRTNRTWLSDFLSGKTRSGWIKANEVVQEFALNLKAKQWSLAAHLLRQEMALRREITPDALIPTTDLLIRQAEENGCGARFTGAGAGGAVWAVGEIEQIRKARIVWEETLKHVRDAKMLDCRVDGVGVV